MVSLRNHGGDLAGNGLVLVKAHIPLGLKAPARYASCQDLMAKLGLKCLVICICQPFLQVSITCLVTCEHISFSTPSTTAQLCACCVYMARKCSTHILLLQSLATPLACLLPTSVLPTLIMIASLQITMTGHAAGYLEVLA